MFQSAMAGYGARMAKIAASEAFELAERLEAGKAPQGLTRRAAEVRDQAWGSVVTYSPKVFIPLTMLCRDVCHYCTFAAPPVSGRPAFMTIDQVLDIARAGAAAGCTEALFTLGDKPELRYRAAREQLKQLGCSSTLEYLARAADAVLEETGLLPHLNPGLIDAGGLDMLRASAPSMGLMLESTSTRLLQKGEAHHGSPDKDPARRTATMDEAGRRKVPFTTGILIGIGETWRERAETLLAIQASHERFGHIQEVIVQNFRAKQGTLMAGRAEPSVQETLAAISLARLILSPDISLQAPPNLAGSLADCRRYLEAGINDWGGVSPVTKDYVNPEAPWPEIGLLRGITESAGHMLVPRLTIYPRYVQDPSWVAKKVRSKVLAQADAAGLARAGDPDMPSRTGAGGPADNGWHAGQAKAVPQIPFFWSGSPAVRQRDEFQKVLEKAKGRRRLSEAEIELLFTARGPELVALLQAADELRQEVSGDQVTFVVNRNINYTNMCYFKCGFCAFSKGPRSLNLRGEPYLLDLEEIIRRTLEAQERGATEVCLQGGIHPSFSGDFYIDVVRTIKQAAPGIHVHAFSPLEIWQGAETKGRTVRDFLWELKDNGLSTLPGTAAEVLDDEVRAVICPDKITTDQWSFVARTAHALGLRMTTTIMFGHADAPRSWARHLGVLREIQADTGGFTEFVPLPFVHMAAPIYLKGKARPGPTFEEALKMHAVARLALYPWITNIQASWVKMGTDGAQMALKAGCNDLGGTLMNETISRAAGASHGQEVSASEMKRLAGQIGRPWARRNTLYSILEREQTTCQPWAAAALFDQR